jgi:DnaJ-class molecular chaperone
LVTLYEAALLEDAESAAILEAYLDRMHSGAWRQKSKTMEETVEAHATTPEDQKLLQARMSRAEAYHVLGLAPGASKSDIESAFNHLVQTGHPNEDVAKDIASKAECAKSILVDE